MADKVLISACLLGDCVRYNGGHNRIDHPALSQLQNEGRLVAVCPEVMGGLPTPRPPAEIDPDTGVVRTQAGQDVTAEFVAGARLAVAEAKAQGITLAILKQNSPSCGSRQVYDGSFQGCRIAGQGVAARLLSENGVRVIGEDELDTL
jgi:uncharacterized protein YbbK (DUF523 family)